MTQKQTARVIDVPIVTKTCTLNVLFMLCILSQQKLIKNLFTDSAVLFWLFWIVYFCLLIQLYYKTTSHDALIHIMFYRFRCKKEILLFDLPISLPETHSLIVLLISMPHFFVSQKFKYLIWVVSSNIQNPTEIVL